MSTGIIDFGSTTLRSDEIVADTHVKIGATTPATNVKLHATGVNPQIRLQDTDTGTASGALVCENGAFQFQTGADFTNNAVGEFRFASVGGTHTFLTIKGNNTDVAESNVTVAGDLIVNTGVSVGSNLTVDASVFHVDAVNDRIGIGTSTPEAHLDVYKRGDGAELVRLNTESPWKLTQNGTGAASSLSLQTTSDNKFFHIRRSDGVSDIAFEVTTDGSRVGIGTDDPGNALHVHSSTGTQLKLSSSSRYSSIAGVDDQGSCFFGNDRGAFRITVGGDTSFTGASEASRVDASGYWKHSKMPAFSAYDSRAGTDFSPETPINFNATMMNIGSCYSTSTGAFTVPVTGYYQFNAHSYNNGSSQVNFAWLWRETSTDAWDEAHRNIIAGSTGGDDMIWTSEQSVVRSSAIFIRLSAGNQIAIGLRGTAPDPTSLYMKMMEFSGFLYSTA
jgi:hypothetical protein